MAHKPNDMKGTKPELRAIAYTHTLPNGDTIVAKVVAYKLSPSGGYQAWVQHPVFGCEMMTEKEGRLEGYTPVYCLTDEQIPDIVKQAIEGAAGGVGLVIAPIIQRMNEQEARITRLEELLARAMSKGPKVVPVPVVVEAPPAVGPTKKTPSTDTVKAPVKVSPAPVEPPVEELDFLDP